MSITAESNLPEVIARFRGMAASSQLIESATLRKSGELFGQTMVNVVRGHTPVGKTTSGKHLRDTTITDPIVSTPAGFTLTTRQTKTIIIRGQQVPLTAVLVGGRGQGFTVYPVVKKAIFYAGIPGGHPWAHTKPGAVAPSEYAHDARAEVQTRAPIEFRAAGRTAVMNVVRGLVA